MNHDYSMDDLFWIGVGASAGGLQPIKDFCGALPPNANMIYIIAQHLSPTHKTMLPELIQRDLQLPVEMIKDGITPRPNTIYVTPPQKDVYVENNKIRLARATQVNSPKPSINRLFESLGDIKKERSIGIVLSGTGTDGATGIKNIRTAGGLTFAQSSKTSKYYGMPGAAIETGCVDHVLPPNEIGQFLAKLSTKSPSYERLRLQQIERTDKFSQLMRTVQESSGISFQNYKKGTLRRRIERRMLANAITEFETYVEFACNNAGEAHALSKDILISVTSFFRDSPPFERLAKLVNKILHAKSPEESIRIWSVGCATGEEAYSLAMLCAEALGGSHKLVEQNIQIFATDVDTDALKVARNGFYNKTAMSDVPLEFRDKYFKKCEDGHVLIKPIKDIVLFASHNIIEDPPFLKIDLITCRNLLIYFEQELQKKVYGIFHYSLREKGHLFLGKSESISQITDLYQPVDQKNKIFQRRGGIENQLGYNFSKSRRPSSSRKVVSSDDKEKDFFSRVQYALIRQLGAASIVVDENLNIERIYGDATPYIKVADGRPSWNLSEIVSEAFRYEIRALVFKAIRSNRTITGPQKKLKIGGEFSLSRVKVFPLKSDDSIENFALVTFEDCGKISDIKDEKSLERPQSEMRFKELEDELTSAREHLQTVIEELETTNEELQTSNEELQSSNEELQSSNEELETTNEEMQSTNEELITLNDELNSKTIELEKTTIQLKNIKNSIPFPVLVIDKQKKILRANTQAKSFFEGTELSGSVITPVSEQLGINDIDAILERVLRNGAEKKLQITYKERHYDIVIGPYQSQTDSIEGAVLSFIDNSESIWQHKKLTESQKRAEAANVAKANFLANISHEIRTPLNAICNVPELLKDSLDDKEVRSELLSILESSSEHLNNLVNDLLDFSKLEAGQFGLQNSSFSPVTLIEEVAKTFSVNAAKGNVDLKVIKETEIPQRLMGDALRIKQILTNLVSNAVKFTSKGKVEITIGGDFENDAFLLKIKVSDTGIGMNESELKCIFEKFTQAENTISRNYGGTGLGLAIVKELVELMKGTIAVESEKNRGSQFSLRLPLPVAEKIQTKTRALSDEELRIFESKKMAQKNPILVVEDNESNSFIISSYLDKLGCQYQIASRGEEGLDLASKKEFRMILLDIQIGNMDGFQFVKELVKKTPEKHKNFPRVIAVTAHVNKDIKKRCLESGMNDFISKPIEFGELKRVIQQNLVSH